MSILINVTLIVLIGVVMYLYGHSIGYDKGFKDGESGNGYF